MSPRTGGRRRRVTGVERKKKEASLEKKQQRQSDGEREREKERDEEETWFLIAFEALLRHRRGSFKEGGRPTDGTS